jgi:hypothetical protein
MESNMSEQANHIVESNKMVTAVEWLEAKLSTLDDWCFIEEWTIKAKAMEREQHGKTWDDALNQVEKRTVWARAMCDFDEYYEETYKK